MRSDRTPGGRLTRAEAQQVTRQRLLDAARQVFAAKGFDRASLDDVAAHAGLTKGAVYSNFATKGDLILALMRQRRADQRRDLSARAIGDPTLPPEERFRQVGTSYAAAMGQREARDWAILVLEYSAHAMRGEPARGVLAEGLSQLREAISESLAETPPEPGRAQSAPATAELAAIVVALDVGLALQHLLDPESVPAELYGTALARLLGAETPVAGAPDPSPRGGQSATRP